MSGLSADMVRVVPQWPRTARQSACPGVARNAGPAHSRHRRREIGQLGQSRNSAYAARRTSLRAANVFLGRLNAAVGPSKIGRFGSGAQCLDAHSGAGARAMASSCATERLLPRRLLPQHRQQCAPPRAHRGSEGGRHGGDALRTHASGMRRLVRQPAHGPVQSRPAAKTNRPRQLAKPPGKANRQSQCHWDLRKCRASFWVGIGRECRHGLPHRPMVWWLLATLTELTTPWFGMPALI